MPPKQVGATSSSSRSIPRKREQIAVACDACRTKKSKCDGCRPACSECTTRGRECQYALEPGEARLQGLKRKYEALEAQTADEHELIENLQSVSERDAIEVLAQLRSQDVESALDRSRSLARTRRNRSASRDTLPAMANQTIPLENTATVGSIIEPANTNLYPGADPETGGSTWASSVAPSIPGIHAESSSAWKTIRKTPSAPEMSSKNLIDSFKNHPRPAPKSDPRLDNVKASDWGISFVSDKDFRLILTAYFAWDYPSWGVFDVDDFCDALQGKPSELSSKLLAMAVFALAAKFYIYFNSSLARRLHQQAWAETRSLWQECTPSGDSDGDGSIATACAAVAICSIHSVDGGDSLGKDCLIRAQEILLAKGLYDPELVDEVYGDVNSRKYKTKAFIAWGMLDYVTFVEFCMKKNAWLLPTPPVPPPHLMRSKGKDTWTPWPLVRPTVPAYTYEFNKARAQLCTISRDITTLQLERNGNGITQAHCDASVELHSRLLQWMNSLPLGLSLVGFATQQLIVLHVWYHFVTVELFRPFTNDPDIQTLAPQIPPEKLRSITNFASTTSTSSLKQLRQLLVRHEALYGGLGVHVLLATPMLAVAFEAMPTASPHSANYSPSSHMAFLTAVRTLGRLSSSVPVINLALLGVRQAALRDSISLPQECGEYFERALRASRGAETEGEAPEGTANWVVDLSRSTTDLEAARLDSLVAEMRQVRLREKEDGSN